MVQREQEAVKSKALALQTQFRRVANPLQKKRLAEQFEKAKRKLAALAEKAQGLQKQIDAAGE